MIIAILQARMNSSRLPNKVLKPILNRPMLALQIERIQRANKIDKIILATSVEVCDQPLVALARELNIECYRGNIDNVLSRYYHAGLAYQPEHVVRLTGDCPVIDPSIIDLVIEHHVQHKFDYTSNVLDPTYPDGFDVEIMTWQTLKDAYHHASLPSEKEHVTLFIHKHPQRYHLGSYKSDNNYSHLRWTVDEQKDIELITRIYENLYPNNANFTYQDILDFIQRNTDLAVYNTKYMRNEGLQTSLLRDPIVLEG